ncbi:RNA polymerase sigma factor [Mariniluteicoccus endophyticus]
MDRTVEAELLDRARGGDGEAFRELVESYRTRVWSICLRTTGNHADAEDAFSEALLAAWRNLDKFRGESAFGSWLYRIASNAALMIIRRRKEQSMDMDEYAERHEGVSDAMDMADQVIENDRLQKAINNLPLKLRAALVLREIADCTYEDIAAQLDIPVQTVKSRLNRARAQLREELTTA